MTVPVEFNDKHILTLETILQQNDYNCIKIVKESIAAGFYYVNYCQQQEQTNLIIDFGQGTTDLTLLSIDRNLNVFEVIKSSCDMTLGGQLITNLIKQYYVEQRNAGKSWDNSEMNDI